MPIVRSPGIACSSRFSHIPLPHPMSRTTSVPFHSILLTPPGEEARLLVGLGVGVDALPGRELRVGVVCPTGEVAPVPIHAAVITGHHVQSSPRWRVRALAQGPARLASSERYGRHRSPSAPDPPVEDMSTTAKPIVTSKGAIRALENLG